MEKELPDTLRYLQGNEKFEQWYSYLKFFNEQNPTEEEKLSAIIDPYFHIKGLAEDIESKFQNSRDLLSTEARLSWILENKSPTDLFKALGFDPVQQNCFIMPGFSNWVKYADEYSIVYSDEKADLPFHFPREPPVLIDMVYAAVNPYMRGDSKRVLDEIMKYWLDKNSKPEELLMDLELKNAGKELFVKPQFKEWFKYVVAYNARNEGSEVSITEILINALDKDKMGTLLPAFEHAIPYTVSRHLLEDAKAWRREHDAFNLPWLNKSIDFMGNESKRTKTSDDRKSTSNKRKAP